jgi:hypothetical protein
MIVLNGGRFIKTRPHEHEVATVGLSAQQQLHMAHYCVIVITAA